MDIYLVKGLYRNSRIEFPKQIKPPKKAIEHWQYFIRFFTKERKLNSPIGDWQKTPYQLYPFVIVEDYKLLYKRDRDKWELYHHNEHTRNLYTSAGTQRTNLPKKWRPFNVINSSKKLLKVILPGKAAEAHTRDTPTVGSFPDETMRTIVGTYRVDQVELALLKEQWNIQTITLLCGSDGGLKD